MIVIVILINILCYWIYYTIRSNSYTSDYKYVNGHYTNVSKKCPLPLYEVVLVGVWIVIPIGFIAIIAWLGISTCVIYEVDEIQLSDKHILKRIYKFITKDLAK